MTSHGRHRAEDGWGGGRGCGRVKRQRRWGGGRRRRRGVRKVPPAAGRGGGAEVAAPEWAGLPLRGGQWRRGGRRAARPGAGSRCPDRGSPGLRELGGAVVPSTRPLAGVRDGPAPRRAGGGAHHLGGVAAGAGQDEGAEENLQVRPGRSRPARRGVGWGGSRASLPPPESDACPRAGPPRAVLRPAARAGRGSLLPAQKLLV